MGFLTGARLELISEYTTLKKIKGKLVIPIGPQKLKIKNADVQTSSNGNLMIVLKLTKPPEIIDEQKYSFNYLLIYFTENRFFLINKFIKEAFSTEVSCKNINEYISALNGFKNTFFDCVICHQKKLIMEDGKPIERSSFKKVDWGIPMVIYEPKILKLGTLDIGSEDHRNLIREFSKEDKEIFNKTLTNRHNRLYGTTDN